MASWLQKTAWFGDLFLEGEIRGVMLWFHGLNGLCRTARNQISALEAEVASRGGLVVFPFCNPWSFLSRNEVAFVDRLIPEIYRQYQLDVHLPLVSAGQSMGGASALLYCRYGKWPVARCAALAPLCDPEDYYDHWTPARPSGCAAMHNMFDPEGGDFRDRLKEHSPLRQAEKMPRIPYLLVHSDGDDIVPKSHSDQMVAELLRANHLVTYRQQRHFGHTALSVRDELAMADFIASAWEN